MKYRDAPLYEWIQKNNVFTATTGQWLLEIHDDEEGAWNDPESRFLHDESGDTLSNASVKLIKAGLL